MKNNHPDYANRRLTWLAYIGGKRESRRLLGDVILIQNDILDQVRYNDASFTTTWEIDLHFPNSRNSQFFPGEEFFADNFHIPEKRTVSLGFLGNGVATTQVIFSRVALSGQF